MLQFHLGQCPRHGGLTVWGKKVNARTVLHLVTGYNERFDIIYKSKALDLHPFLFRVMTYLYR